jgi:hypothetical protein
VIKRIQFFSTRSQAEAPWLKQAAAPLRAVICHVIHDAQGPIAPHAAIGIAWFQDLAALRPNEDCEPGTVIIAEEHILRGADWLDLRWRDPMPKYKHMALARRAAGLSAAEFSERWRNRSGRMGGGSAAPTLEIPAAARGHAYVQNHPVHGTHHALYDAINEVYFDDIASMQSRLELFANHNAVQHDADLVSEARFVIVEEQLLP